MLKPEAAMVVTVVAAAVLPRKSRRVVGVGWVLMVLTRWRFFDRVGWI
jgi:hypothetical protein